MHEAIVNISSTYSPSKHTIVLTVFIIA